MKSSLNVGKNDPKGHASLFGFARRPMALALALLMTGCGIRPVMEQDFDGAARIETKQQKPENFNSEVETGYSEAEGFMLRKPEDRQSGPLPPAFQKKIQNLTVTESSVYDALQLIADEAGLSLSIEGGARALERYGSIAMYNVSGTIEKVLDKMSGRLGFYWYVEDGTLVVEQERDFVIDMPPALADDNMSLIANTFMAFGIKDPLLDHQARSLSFKANRRAIKMVEEYLEKIRATRSMIAYSINIWQVDLTDGNQKGVDWNKFGATYAKGSLGLVNTAVNTTTKGLGMVFANNTVSVDGILGYLETQGTVKTVSQPRISILSNTKGKIAIGQATTYVSKVGTNVSSALSQVTVETQSLQTGLQMVLHGEVHDNTVYTRVHLSLSDLLKMNKFTALGTDLNLPQTASRELETTTRVKPGDIIVLGGITVNSDTADDTTSFANIVRSRTSLRNELVIAIRPVLVNFRGAKQRETLAPLALPALPAATALSFDDVKPKGFAAPVVATEMQKPEPAKMAPLVSKKSEPEQAAAPAVVPTEAVQPVVRKASRNKNESAGKPSDDKALVVEVKPAHTPHGKLDRSLSEPPAIPVPEKISSGTENPEPAVEQRPSVAQVRMDLDRAEKESKPAKKGSWEFEFDRTGMTGKTVVTRGF